MTVGDHSNDSIDALLTLGLQWLEREPTERYPEHLLVAMIAQLQPFIPAEVQRIVREILAFAVTSPQSDEQPTIVVDPGQVFDHEYILRLCVEERQAITLMQDVNRQGGCSRLVSVDTHLYYRQECWPARFWAILVPSSFSLKAITTA